MEFLTQSALISEVNQETKRRREKRPFAEAVNRLDWLAAGPFNVAKSRFDAPSFITFSRFPSLVDGWSFEQHSFMARIGRAEAEKARIRGNSQLNAFCSYHCCLLHPVII